jgi:hypothetical protein
MNLFQHQTTRDNATSKRGIAGHTIVAKKDAEARNEIDWRGDFNGLSMTIALNPENLNTSKHKVNPYAGPARRDLSD